MPRTRSSSGVAPPNAIGVADAPLGDAGVAGRVGELPERHGLRVEGKRREGLVDRAAGAVGDHLELVLVASRSARLHAVGRPARRHSQHRRDLWLDRRPWRLALGRGPRRGQHAARLATASARESCEQRRLKQRGDVSPPAALYRRLADLG